MGNEPVSYVRASLKHHETVLNLAGTNADIEETSRSSFGLLEAALVGSSRMAALAKEMSMQQSTLLRAANEVNTASAYIMLRPCPLQPKEPKG